MVESVFKPAQAYDHELNPVKGWPSPYALDKTLPIDQSGDEKTVLNISPVLAGQVGFKDDTTPFSFVWSPTTSTATPAFAPMPLFVFNSGNDFDAIGDHGNIVGAITGGTRAPAVLCLPACGAFELQTTEFVAGSYKPGDLLVSNLTGKVTLADPDEGSLGQIVCGCVSDGKVDQDHTSGETGGTEGFLQFWSVFLPGTVALAAT